jgi:hypothetical protein
MSILSPPKIATHTRRLCQVAYSIKIHFLCYSVLAREMATTHVVNSDGISVVVESNDIVIPSSSSSLVIVMMPTR